ncbi:hypothetical protein BJ508DRAFT_29218 [Ascobolus immersus RN42]|uniref:Uncharacterized protein n=1 Tax=Ascobolus immersus RN42 TaxID=1160509 RepID=A0A3N4HS18_ASCIM|nr:hypothetical protein BJ508DRAFT_29218 [Ascobolus immersus RN42]
MQSLWQAFIAEPLYDITTATDQAEISSDGFIRYGNYNSIKGLLGGGHRIRATVQWEIKKSAPRSMFGFKLTPAIWKDVPFAEGTASFYCYECPYFNMSQMNAHFPLHHQYRNQGKCHDHAQTAAAAQKENHEVATYEGAATPTSRNSYATSLCPPAGPHNDSDQPVSKSVPQETGSELIMMGELVGSGQARDRGACVNGYSSTSHCSESSNQLQLQPQAVLSHTPSASSVNSRPYPVPDSESIILTFESSDDDGYSEADYNI